MTALAYTSGHYKHKLLSKSLLNGQENQTTILMRSIQARGKIYERNAYTILRKYWEPRLVEGIRNMKPLKD